MSITWDEVEYLVRHAEITCEGELPRGASEVFIESFECRIGLRLPPIYREWLGKFNGAPVGPGGIYGIDCQIKYWDLESNQNGEVTVIAERAWLRIAGDGCGNSYVLAARGGFGLSEPIFFQQALFHRSEQKATYIAASNMKAFVAGLLMRERDAFHWPFDRERTLRLDPLLIMASEIPLPWESS